MIHLQASSFRFNFERRFHPLVRALTAHACKHVALALVQAECLRDQFAGLMPENRIRVLYNATEPAALITQEYTQEQHRVLFLGHLTKAKGYCDLVRAIPLVVQQFPDVEFCFGGTLRSGERGVFYDQTNGVPLTYEDPVPIHREISSGPFARNYRFLGVVSGRQKLDLIRSSSLVALPSYSEGFSCVLLEGMAAGKPLVWTPVGAHREVVTDGENGFAVKPGDVKGLAQRICALLADSALRRRIGDHNARYVSSRFSHQTAVDALRFYLESAIRFKRGDQ